MAITYRKTDDLEKILENFASLPNSEGVVEPDPKGDATKDKEAPKA